MSSSVSAAALTRWQSHRGGIRVCVEGGAKPLVEGIREAGFDRSLTWQGTADGFRSARWESLRALPLGGKGRSLSGRLTERSES